MKQQAFRKYQKGFTVHIFSNSILTVELFNKVPMYEQVDYIWKNLIQQSLKRKKPLRKKP